ncbi:LacI family DNA-binding transcriptional regulator [Curtobacterium sp. MCJR17_043]|uniref:LacI family DNA-binding transcriptional regulator n=1 Tax=Curtobacterium sp. MCJR17_043 TaxID=2175660 RepID=UPI0024DFCF80|nr:LacI family DNA-binding transcriptional regulator [Curtobacterium sp. MCJR17_043]WIB37075.1 LacI family DNA-binding transcriptional regulator [Curtobacterium sp. MCJR17_043]
MTTPNGRPRKAPTIFDVAERAGVSHQTVSRVINGDPTVRDGFRSRVTTAIGELGYRPRAAARALAGGRSRALGLVSAGGRAVRTVEHRDRVRAGRAHRRVPRAPLDAARRPPGRSTCPRRSRRCSPRTSPPWCSSPPTTACSTPSAR